MPRFWLLLIAELITLWRKHGDSFFINKRRDDDDLFRSKRNDINDFFKNRINNSGVHVIFKCRSYNMVVMILHDMCFRTVSRGGILPRMSFCHRKINRKRLRWWIWGNLKESMKRFPFFKHHGFGVDLSDDWRWKCSYEVIYNAVEVVLRCGRSSSSIWWIRVSGEGKWILKTH